eukprot:GEMP01073473.1.p1 GENE.GEMP01073473.1~~GEMP01073473.1.p1  ORF type:complete len:212 (+),score=35.91 GEMP01073473.1:134-769(+)
MGNRETSVYLSKVAEQAERYDEMAEYMKKVAEAKEELNAEERNLFSVAYKNAVGSRRASWRIISDVEQKERTLGHKEFYMAAEDFRKRVEEELHQICNEVIALLNDCLIPMANNGESNVFYFKMKGDVSASHNKKKPSSVFLFFVCSLPHCVTTLGKISMNKKYETGRRPSFYPLNKKLCNKKTRRDAARLNMLLFTVRILRFWYTNLRKM